MSKFVESLKRLYSASRVNVVKLDELKTNGKITQEEYNHILSKVE